MKDAQKLMKQRAESERQTRLSKGSRATRTTTTSRISESVFQEDEEEKEQQVGEMINEVDELIYVFHQFFGDSRKTASEAFLLVKLDKDDYYLNPFNAQHTIMDPRPNIFAEVEKSSPTKERGGLYEVKEEGESFCADVDSSDE